MGVTQRTLGVVTGAGRGMGRACAEALAGDVDVLVVVDRDERAVVDASERLAAAGAAVEPFVADVTDRARLDELAAVAAQGRLRAVAHAAGISPTMADWRQIIAVDLVGSALLLDALEPLATAGTAAVLFSSMAAQILVPDGDPAVDAVIDDPLAADLLDRLEAVEPAIGDPAAAYAWAKRGVQRLARREAVRWGARGARVCSVSPGMIDTPLGRQEADAQPAMAALLELTPLRREGEAREVAAVVAFLLSDAATFVTGTDVLVDGGVCAALAHPQPTSTRGTTT